MTKEDFIEIQSLLIDIKKRPGVYIGKKSLNRLAFFISGYTFHAYQHNNTCSKQSPRFQDFIERKFNIDSSHHWVEIIEFFSVSDETAFDDFYRLLKEFMSEKTMM